MISELKGHVRYKASWLLAFAVGDFHSLVKDNRYVLRDWLGTADSTLNDKECWFIRDKYLGNITIVSGPEGTSYNLAWDHYSGDYRVNFRNKSWFYFFKRILKNIDNN